MRVRVEKNRKREQEEDEKRSMEREVERIKGSWEDKEKEWYRVNQNLKKIGNGESKKEGRMETNG